MRIPKRNDINQYTDTQITRLQRYLNDEVLERFEASRGLSKIMKEHRLTGEDVIRLLEKPVGEKQ